MLRARKRALRRRQGANPSAVPPVVPAPQTFMGAGTYTYDITAPGVYSISCIGGGGGNSGTDQQNVNGGLGASIAANFMLADYPQTLQIIIGGNGFTAADAAGGGGGASAVSTSTRPLLVAGGGGGALPYYGTNGVSAPHAGTQVNDLNAQGKGGIGGSNNGGGGGASFTTSGSTQGAAGSGQPGTALNQGAQGGDGDNGNINSNGGGFGGGGGGGTGGGGGGGGANNGGNGGNGSGGPNGGTNQSGGGGDSGVSMADLAPGYTVMQGTISGETGQCSIGYVSALQRRLK